MSSRTKRAIVWRIIFRRKGNAHTQREPTELFLQSLSGRRCIGRSFIFYFFLFHFRLEKRRRRGNRACSQACIGPPLNYYSLSAAANTAREEQRSRQHEKLLYSRVFQTRHSAELGLAGWLVVISCRPSDESSATSIVISYIVRAPLSIHQ